MIKKWDADQLINLNLNPDDLRYLTYVGLETGEHAWLVVLEEYETLDGVIIGYDHFPIVCTSAGLYLVEDMKRSFVNSSIEQFMNCFERYKSYGRDIQRVGSDDEAAMPFVKSAIAGFQRIDPVACSNEEYYWPIISAQVIEGNLYKHRRIKSNR